MTDHRAWVRECAVCKEFVFGDGGEISTYPAPDGRGGIVELPMSWADAGGNPPCGACPKVLDAGDPKPLAPEDDFGEWFWAMRQRFVEGRAIGDHGDPDPLIRAIFAEFDLSDRRQAAQDQAAMIASVVGLVRK